MSSSPVHIPPASDAHLRSGNAARMAGLPVTTLRVWERRYGVVAASKTATGQRLYSNHDVMRLRLLRQLTHNGHAIGTIATLELALLQTLAAGVPLPASTAVPTARTVVVIGRSAARRLEKTMECDVKAVYEDMDQAETQHAVQHGANAGVDILLVRLTSLQPTAVERVRALARAFHAGTSIVLYNFAAEGTVEALGAAGVTTHREPILARDLTRLILGEGNVPAPSGIGLQIAPRRFDDETLADLAESPSSIACECLRHVAELSMQLASFERYSEECASTNAADASLHRHLNGMAGAARTLFEQTLEQMMTNEGLASPRRPNAQVP